MKNIIFVCLGVIFFLCFSGCADQKETGRKEKVSYAVCREDVIPKELAVLIKKEKKESCHFTYSTKDFTYYVICYGSQNGHGYKVKVKEFTMDRERIYIDTTLVGITKEHQKNGKTYPYLVLKSQYYEKDTIFR